MKLLVLSFVFCCAASTVHSALYKECKNFPMENIADVVSVSNCKASYCPLKKGSRSQLEIKFVADKEIKSITNTVSADVGPLSLPFVGVDGSSGNHLVYEADGKTAAKFPLEAGKQYIYKNGIDVLKVFPSIKVNVHWQLDKEDGTPVACFEVPARIVN